MRPAWLALLPVVVAVVLVSSCGGGSGQATGPPDPGTLISEARAAASGEHSARFHLVILGRILHSHPLPSGVTAGPYGIAVRGAVTSEDGGRADLIFDVRQPGATASVELREIGRKVYIEVPGGQWYSEPAGDGPAQSPGAGQASAILGQLFAAGEGDWLAGLGARRDGRADAIDGELDVNGFSSDVATLLRQMHVPRPDAGLIRYVTESIRNVTWTLTFDHGSHLVEGLHARAGLTFRPDILRQYGISQPFGLPAAADGMTVTLSAHLTHWGASVHVSPPARATPLPTPGLPAV